jgi:AraC family transcriptional activator of pyochelin receptor
MPFEKKFRKKFILLKFIELIWMGVYDLIEENESNIKSLHLTSQDFKKIHQSKDILLDNLENPPSLSALAKIVGLNEYKLKVGFKSVFGLPPYTLLQEHKLILAKKMLESGNQSVTEVAIKIGYSNFSKFSLAFKKKFGKNPSSIRKNT